MADNIDPQQIDDLNKNLQNLIDTLGGTANKANSLGKGMGDLLGVSKPLQGLLGGLGTSAGNLGKSLYKGEKGAQVFGNAVEDAAAAVGLLLVALGPFSLAAKLAAGAVMAFAKGLNASAKQGDALYKTYQELQRSGATAADGITGVFNNMQKFGYGIEELDKMVRLVSDNSQTLAKFSLTAADGTTAFASAMQNLVRDQGLKELGKMPEDITAAGATYIRQQVAAGRTQKEIGDTLAAGTRQYIMDLDRLQRLTGKSADQLQKEQDAAMAEDAYNDVMSELKARAASGDKVAEEQIRKITTAMSFMSDDMKRQYARGIGGDISAMGQLFMTVPSLLKNTMDETVSATQTIDEASKDATNFAVSMGRTYRLGAESAREAFGSLKDIREFGVATADIDKRNAAAAKNAVVTDSATKSLALIDLESMNSRDALQSFVQLGVAPATRALAKLSEITTGVTRMAPGTGVGAENNVGAKLDRLGTGRGGSANADAAMKFFMSAGWSKEQAAGIVGNLQVESGRNLNTGAVGDGGKAKGIAQWHPDRQANFARVMGKSLEESTLEDQLKFVDWELKNTEKSAGDKLRAAASAAQAAQIVDKLYERSSGAALADRIASARMLAGPGNGYQSTTAGLQPNASLPGTPTGTAPQAGSGGLLSENLISIIADKLSSLNQTMTDVRDNTKKTANYAGN